MATLPLIFALTAARRDRLRLQCHEPCQYIRGQGIWLRAVARQRADCRRRLAGLTIGHDFEFDLLSFVEVLHAGALDRADMHEDVFAAVIRLNEAEAFLAVEPFNCAL